jgi:hypothetical protein
MHPVRLQTRCGFFAVGLFVMSGSAIKGESSPYFGRADTTTKRCLAAADSGSRQVGRGPLISFGTGWGTVPVQRIGATNWSVFFGGTVCRTRTFRAGVVAEGYSAPPVHSPFPQPSFLTVRKTGIELQYFPSRTNAFRPFIETAVGAIRTVYKGTAENNGNEPSSVTFLTPGFGWELRMGEHARLQFLGGFQFARNTSSPGLVPHALQGQTAALRLRLGEF